MPAPATRVSVREAIPIRGQLKGEQLIMLLNKMYEQVKAERHDRLVKFRIAYLTYEEVLVDAEDTAA